MREADENRWSALMVSAQAGNPDDYRVLLQELGDVVHAFLASRFGRHDFIEDCVQEALMAIHLARHTYDPSRPFRPWMFAIVRHKTIDILRKQRSRAQAADHYAREQATLSQATVTDGSGDRAAGDGLLERLPEKHREILVLTKIIGYSMAEAAGRLGITQSAAKVRVHRAIHKLRQLMEEEAGPAQEAPLR
jgi:RNA polymerase sigma-70 factor (ECF subfamily)